MIILPFAFLAAFNGAAVAQTSLYIPGFDPQPISADILGIDAQGRTTWALHQGSPTDTFDPEGSFPGTATLVEGANDVSFTYAAPSGLFTMGRECALSNGLAICSATFSGELLTETETIDFITVEAGTTAAPSSPTETTPATIPTSISSQPSSQIGSSAQTSEKTSSAPSPTQTSNAAVTFPHFFGFILSLATVVLVL